MLPLDYIETSEVLRRKVSNIYLVIDAFISFAFPARDAPVST